METIIYDYSNDVMKITFVLKQKKYLLRKMYITDLISDTEIAYWKRCTNLCRVEGIILVLPLLHQRHTTNNSQSILFQLTIFPKKKSLVATIHQVYDRVLKMCRRPAISPATSGWEPSTNLSKLKIEVGKTEMLSRYLLFSRSLL